MMAAPAVSTAPATVIPSPLVSVETRPPVDNVIVHPLVLLSVVDHFNRMGKVGHSKRVMGIMLGSWSAKGVLDISNRQERDKETVEKLKSSEKNYR
jgi:hypothetical protein